MTKQILVREIEGHKFFSTVHATKEAAAQTSKTQYDMSPLFVYEHGGWLNGNFAGFSKSFQEDTHVAP
jgi:hypothetical protein